MAGRRELIGIIGYVVAHGAVGYLMIDEYFKGEDSLLARGGRGISQAVERMCLRFDGVKGEDLEINNSPANVTTCPMDR